MSRSQKNKKLRGSSETVSTPVASPVSTAVRGTPVPRPQASAAVKTVAHEDIARRAREIYLSGQGGSDVDNWLQAERELRGL